MATAVHSLIPAEYLPFLGESYAAPRVAAQPVEELGYILSPSQLRTFMDCQARWYFKYVQKLPDPQNANLALGTAVHSALGYNFAQKIESGRDLPLGDVLSHFDTDWELVAAETTFRDEEDPAEIGAAGRGLVEKYMREAAPSIDPAGVEVQVEGTIAGVRVQGKLDVIEKNGRVRDIKTSSRKSSAVSNEQAFQLATYVPLTKGTTGEVVIDQLVKTKTPQLVQLEHTVSAADIRATEEMYPLAQNAMRQQIYMPNRTSNLCSKRNCSFWRQCAKEFGGCVEEA